uniref:PARP4 MVP-ID C-terminal domain-containing protein n=1 Tax=Xiphophorus couchianus TaxID=32473 RepID=A0A3B5L274_9TELE
MLYQVPESDPKPPHRLSFLRDLSRVRNGAPTPLSEVGSIQLDRRVAPPLPLQVFSEASLPPLQVTRGGRPPPPAMRKGAPPPPGPSGAPPPPVAVQNGAPPPPPWVFGAPPPLQGDGYWELTVELGKLVNVNVDAFANVFLKNKGIHSLGERIRRLVATLLVLQLMREEELEEGKLLQSLFNLKEPTGSERWQQVKKAVDWVRWADREYPCACSRLEFGWSWESSTRQLLGFERFPPFSPLISLELQKTAAPLAIH